MNAHVRRTTRSHHHMRRTALHLIVAWLGMWVCVIISAAIWAWLAPMGRGWQVVPTVALLLFAFGALVRARFAWPFRDYLASFVVALATLLFGISWFSGYQGLELFDSFNLEFLAFFGAVVGSAWFGGFAAGSIGGRRSIR